MFYVINKEKLTAYAISVATVVVLFVMAGTLMPKNNTIETSVEVKNENNTKQLKTDENATNSDDNQVCG